MKKTISIAKKLINLPYNKFSLQTYYQKLYSTFGEIKFINTDPKMPIRLMAGNPTELYDRVGIISTNRISNKAPRKIYIVGKGILFDSGGLDIKRDMNGMHSDKAGMIIAVTVSDYLKGNVIPYCPVTTNFIQTSLITPGDEICIGNKIVKVTNTDAEGRLILAEALNKLEVTKDDIVITIATLTGCCEYAIDKATGVLSPNDKFAEMYIESAVAEKEYAWRLPLWDYAEKLAAKSPIQNSVKEIKADTIGAALFLKQFVKYPDRWIHLDIAASSSDKNGNANGVPVKSLINFIKKIK